MHLIILFEAYDVTSKLNMVCSTLRLSLLLLLVISCDPCLPLTFVD